MEEGIHSRETKTEKIIQTIKNSLFNTYYSMQSRGFYSNLLFLFILTFELMQISCLILFHINYSTIAYPLHYTPISKVLDILRMTFALFIQHRFIPSMIFLYLYLIYFLIHLGVFMYFSKFNFEYKQSKQIHIDIFFKVLFHIDVFIITLFSIPFYINSFSFFQCNSDNTLLNYRDVACYDVIYYFNCIFASIDIILYTTLGYLHCLFLNDNTPIGKLPWSNSFNHNKAIMLILKLCLSLFYVIEFKYSFHLKVFITFGLSVFIIVLRLFNQFFHRKAIGNFIICYEYAISLYTIIGIVNNYTTITYSLKKLIIELITGLGFGVLFIFVYSKLREQFIYINKRSYVYEYIAFSKLMQLITKAKSIDNKDLLSTFFISILQKHRLRCIDEACRCGEYATVITNIYKDSRALIGYTKYFKYDVKHLNSDNSPRTNFFVKTNTISSVIPSISPTPITTDGDKGVILRNKTNKTFNTNTTLYSQIEDLDMVNISFTQELQLSIPDVIYGVIRIVLESLIVFFPKSARMKILFAYLMMFYLGNDCKALYELMKIPIHNQSLMIQYEIFLCKKQIEAKMQYESSNQLRDTISMETILLFNRLTNHIIDLINITSKDVIRFWEEILGFSAVIKFMEENHFYSMSSSQFQAIPTYSKGRKSKHAVYKYAASIAKKMASMEIIYGQLRQNANFRNIIVFKLYASFLEKVICNEEGSKEILLFIENSRCNFNKKGNETYIFIEGKINLDDIGSCVVSGDLNNLGRIIHCNLQFGNIFKYEKEQLKFERVNKICPSYIAEYHNDFIIKYYETGKRHLMGMNKIIFGLRSDGVVIPVVSFIKTVPNLEDSIRFIGLFKVLSKDHPFWAPAIGVDYEFVWKTKNVSFILVTEKGNVFGITKGALKLYGIPLNILMTNSSEVESDTQKETKVLNIKQLFPLIDFENKEQNAKLTTDGCEMILDSSSLKKNYADFIESLQSGNSLLLKSLNKTIPDLLFKKSLVYVKLIEILFNSGTMKIKIFKIVKKKTLQVRTKTNKNLDLNNIFKNLVTESVMHVQNPKVKTKSSIKKIASSLSQTSRRNSVRNSISNVKIEVRKPFIQLRSVKDSLRLFSIPLQAKILLLCFIIVYLGYSSIGVLEYILNVKYSNDIVDYYLMYHSFNLRNLYLSSIILYFNTLVFLDNGIYSPDVFNRGTIINKLTYDLGKYLDLSSVLDSFINSKDKEVSSMYNIIPVSTKSLKSDFSEELKNETLSFTYRFILVKIAHLLTKSQDNLIDYFKLDNINDLFYLNPNFQKSNEANLTLVEYFYITENYNDQVRFLMEKIEDLMGARLTEPNIFNRNDRIIIIYLPFVLVVIALALCLILLRKFTEYKIKILKVFYLVNKKYGYEIIKRCKLFLEYTTNFTKYTKKDIDVVMKEMSLQSERLRSTSYSQSHQATDNVIGVVIKSPTPIKTVQFDEDTQSVYSNTKLKGKSSKKASSKRIISLANPNKAQIEVKPQVKTPPKKRDIMKSRKSLTNTPEQNAKTMLFWEREERERQDSVEEKQIGEKVINELAESKKALKRKMLIIVLYITLLLLCTVIYFIVSIILNNQFDQEITDTFPYFYYFSNRGWLFTNVLILYRQMIMSNNAIVTITNYSSHILYTQPDLSPADLSHLYLNQSYTVENQILLLTNSFLEGFNKEMLKLVIDADHQLNSDQYCSKLEQFNSDFYNEFQSNCEQFYKTNLGLKDNIQIIINYIQAQTIDFVDKPIGEVMKILEFNSSFINNNELFISQSIIIEMEEAKKGIELFIKTYQVNAIIRLVVFSIIELGEIIAFGIIWKYLVDMLIKEKAILNIIPNEAIALSWKVKKELAKLKVFQ